jgi:hypothetical protein
MSTPPQISSTLPVSGPLSGGAQVNISGSGLSNATGVFFGLMAATEFDVESDTLIFAIAPPGSEAGTVAVTVVTPNGDSVPSPSSQFTYISDTPPSIMSVFPALGALSGGTQITIKGSDFNGTLGVEFGSIPAPEFLANSDNSILVTSPAGFNPGIVPVTVTTASGSSAPAPTAVFTYLPPSTGTSQGSSSSQGGSQSTGGSQSGQQGGQQQGGSGDAQQGQQGGPQQQGGTSGKSQSGQSNGQSSAQGGGQQTGSSESQGSSNMQGQQGGAQKSGTQSGTQPSGTTSTSSSNSGPTPGDYIPGGLGPVPGGLTGLGGTAGTGAGFGVGTLMPGGGGSAPPSNLPYYVDPGLTGQLVQSLIGIVQTATSPDALEAQSLILRRMALEGDVVGSRLPPPRNISEIGGYLNLLGTLTEKDMREQALAGILGVAGPTKALGWISNTMPLSMVAITNDRPPVMGQSSVPLTVLVRSDFVGPLQNALKALHSYGATLPLTGPPVLTLPPGGTGTVPPSTSNILFYLGRAIAIAPSMALSIPGVDPVALVSAAANGPFLLATNVLYAATAPVPLASQAPGDLYAIACTPTTETVVQMQLSPYILLAPTLANAGYYPAATPIPIPTNSTVTSWAWLTNTTGLVAGRTELGDELSLLYRQDQIASSVFASMLTWTWNGTAFMQS